MRALALAAVSSVLAFGLAACGDRDGDAANNTAATNTAGTEATSGNSAGAAGAGGAGAATASSWPEGARIVEENGVTYRVDSSGTRVQLGPNESRIVTEGGVRYRVDPGGVRVRIDDRGAVRIGDSVIRGNAPNGRSDVETPGETASDAVEDAAEAVGDAVPD